MFDMTVNQWAVFGVLYLIILIAFFRFSLSGSENTAEYVMKLKIIGAIAAAPITFFIVKKMGD